MQAGQDVKITPRSKRKGFKGSVDQWESEIRGSGATEAQQAHIASLPRVESRNSQIEDGLAELKEVNAAKAHANKLPDNEWIKRNEHQRRGKPMHHRQFLQKLRAAGLQCWYNAEPFEGQIGLRAVRKGYEQLGVQFVCAVKLGWTTEYDFFHYDRNGVELNKKFIGWRSVIIQLITKGFLTEQQAHKIFGKPDLNEASLLYRRSLWQIRAAA